MFDERMATLDGFEGRIVVRGGDGGEWAAELEPDVLVRLLQVAASGQDVPLDGAGGVRQVVIRRCWYDVQEHAMHATFETAGLAA